MSVNVDGQALVKSVVTMLPVINLSVTNMRALHFLLCFVAEQSKNNKLLTPSIKCDKPLYVKACEIVMTNKTEIFVRLWWLFGIYWLFIGKKWPQRSTRNCLCSRNCWPHDHKKSLYPSCALSYDIGISCLIINVRGILTRAAEQAQLVKIYDSLNPEECKD